MKKSRWTIWICLLSIVFVFAGDVSAAPPYSITLTHIKFNHNTGSNSTDGVTIKENETAITAPEWVTGGANDPVCYIKSSNKTIKVRFTCDADWVTSAQILATKTAGSILTNIAETTVTFSNGVSSPEYQDFTLTSVPTNVNKSTALRWQWKEKYQGNNYNITSTGPHEIYVIIASPQEPQATPWAEALSVACGYAGGASTAAQATDYFTFNLLFDATFGYDTVNGAASYTTNGKGTNFWLDDFLTNFNGSGGDVNCYDMGKAVKTFANALGCNALYKYVRSFGYVNCIKPTGEAWTNNPFHDNSSWSDTLIVGEDDDSTDGRSKFTNHSFGAIGDDVYDALMSVDNDANPDAAPHSEYYLTGVAWSTYKGLVKDDDPAYTTSTPETWSFIVQ